MLGPQGEQLTPEQALRQLEAQVLQLQTQLAAVTGGGKGAGKGVPPPGLGVDTRVLGRPELFHGDDKSLYEWSQVFRAYAGLVQAGIRELMLKAEDNSQEVENVSLDVPSESCSLTLHYLLVMICRKEAGVIVHNAGDSEGASGIAESCCTV